MSEMHLKQTRSTYSACGPFTKIKERFQIFKETRDSRYLFSTILVFNMIWLREILKI